MAKLYGEPNLCYDNTEYLHPYEVWRCQRWTAACGERLKLFLGKGARFTRVHANIAGKNMRDPEKIREDIFKAGGSSLCTESVKNPVISSIWEEIQDLWGVIKRWPKYFSCVTAGLGRKTGPPLWFQHFSSLCPPDLHHTYTKINHTEPWQKPQVGPVLPVRPGAWLCCVWISSAFAYGREKFGSCSGMG